MLATAKGESELVKLLLAHGADPNISDAVRRDTAGAATKAQPPLLLSYTHTHLRATSTDSCCDGWCLLQECVTPLMVAASRNMKRAVKALVDKGAVVDATNKVRRCAATLFVQPWPPGTCVGWA